LGGIAYCLLFLSAHLIADFYSESRLVSLIRVTGIFVVINAFQVVQVAKLSRKLDFKTQFRAAITDSQVLAVIEEIIASYKFGNLALTSSMIVIDFFLAFLRS
jgi:hypothetical protein